MYPKISFIIPIYNVEIYIKQCLKSIVNQTLKEIEIMKSNYPIDIKLRTSLMKYEKYKILNNLCGRL